MTDWIWIGGAFVALAVVPAGVLAGTRARRRGQSRRDRDSEILEMLVRSERANHELRRALYVARRDLHEANTSRARADATQAAREPPAPPPRLSAGGRAEEPEARYFEAVPRTATKK